ncbi:LacI family DNA-binding transcriptional regulator [Elstera cyanobacteriorum]|uniref:HTH lacI-type domain-containing protein n=1 Tax=Elstera cyanobacteriorum TaxID=2022747 RepID=A0A255XZW4_9PROT|nr:LacI family DNA-binding transcriptional regulator [Elstera cyanobacteriorum]OYQ22463.1 hypothetical protein CHR90_00260 [Elstera cyanobacteriorum]
MGKTTKLVTLESLAAQAGVSTATASRALAGNPRLSVQTRERITALAAEMGYEPRTKPAAGPRRRQGVIGLVVAGLKNSFSTYLLEYMHDECAAAGYNVVLIVDSLEDPNDRLTALVQEKLDGVILTTASIGSPIVDRLQADGMPFVLAVRNSHHPGVDVIEIDNAIAGEEAARHLYALGHRRIGFLMGPQNTSTSRDRFSGSRRFLASIDAPVAPELTLWGSYSHESGYSGLLTLMQRPEPPTGIICGNDVIAIGALEAAHKHRINVPGDLSLVGFDDIPLAGWHAVQLTTIRQPIQEMARVSVRCLIDRIEKRNQHPARREILPAHLVMRATTAPPRPRRMS